MNLLDTPPELALALGGGALIGSLMLGQEAIRRAHPTYGGARFESPWRVRRSSLARDDGVIVGYLGSTPLRVGESLSVAVEAGTGGGKTAAIAVPNLLMWPGSCVVTDCKPELFDLTSAYRARHGQRVFRFAPFDPSRCTARYNPLGQLPADDDLAVDRLSSIATLWYPDDPHSSDIWAQTARLAFIGLALYCRESPSLPLTFGELYRQGTGRGHSLHDHVDAILAKRGGQKKPDVPPEALKNVADGPPLSDACRTALDDFAGSRGSNIGASVKTGFTAPLTPWVSPILDDATSASDFDFENLIASPDGPMTVYLVMTPDELARFAPLVRLIFSQIVTAAVRRDAGQALRPEDRALILADEAGQLKRVPAFEQAISFTRDFGLSLISIYQGESQLSANPPEGYGEKGARTFLKNHSVRIWFTPDDHIDAESYSKALGPTTVRSRSWRREKLFGGGEAEAARPLMFPQELERMSQKHAIVRVKGMRPILARKGYYFQDPEMLDRLCEVSPYLAGRRRQWWKPLTKADFFTARTELSLDVPPLPPRARPAPTSTPARGGPSFGEAFTPADPLGDDATDEEVQAVVNAAWIALGGEPDSPDDDASGTPEKGGIGGTIEPLDPSAPDAMMIDDEEEDSDV